jgi:hypothetical protein
MTFVGPDGKRSRLSGVSIEITAAAFLHGLSEDRQCPFLWNEDRGILFDFGCHRRTPIQTISSSSGHRYARQRHDPVDAVLSPKEVSRKIKSPEFFNVFSG